MSDDLRVREYRPGDEVGIQALFAAVHRSRAISEWRWRFRNAPNGPAVIHVVEINGAIVGHYAHVPFDVFVDGTKVLLGHGGDLIVSVDHRRKGLMKMLIDHYLAADMGFDLRLNFPTDQALRLGERYGAGRPLGRMHRWVRPRDPGAIRRLGSVGRALSAGRLIERGFDALARHPRGGLALEEETDLGTEFDALAARSAGFAPCVRVRDAAYLKWRWFDQPGPRWRLLSARDRSGALRGWAVFGSEQGDRVHRAGGYVVDILAEDATATRTLLAAASSLLLSNGSPTVVFEYCDPRPWAMWACFRAGFLIRHAGQNVLGRVLSDRVSSERVEVLANWYLTSGDSDLA